MMVKGCELFWSPTCFPARSPCSSVTQCLPWDPALFCPTLIWALVQVRCQVPAKEVSPSENRFRYAPACCCLSPNRSTPLCAELLRERGFAWQGSPEANASQKEKLIKCLVTRSAAPGSLPVPGPSELSPGTHRERRDLHRFLPHFPPALT